jgi:glycosyltransferase involved in cell wall biosynthesis
VWVGDGDGEIRSRMERDGWTVTGWVDSEQVNRFMAAATVLLHPARYEGLSLAIVESLAHGTPVVARNITSNTAFGGVRLFETTEVAVVLLERLMTDREEWSVLSKAALEYVEREHGAPAQAMALAQLYGEVSN